MALQAPLSQLPVRMPHPPLKQYLLMPMSMQSLSILGPDLWTALPSLVTSPLKTLRRNRVARLKAEPEAQPTQHKQTTTERSIARYETTRRSRECTDRKPSFRSLACPPTSNSAVVVWYSSDHHGDKFFHIVYVTVVYNPSPATANTAGGRTNG
ncbi:hypothetical protein KCU88_g3347, partial [Aureobasidium melanogenum]